MKIYFILLITSFISFGCNEMKSDKTSESEITKKVEDYIKSKTNNPELYKSVKTSYPELIIKKEIINECYYNKYAPKEIDFNKKNTFKIPPVSEITEKFYSIVHEFNSQNKFGAIIKQTAVIYLDSLNTIIAYQIF